MKKKIIITIIVILTIIILLLFFLKPIESIKDINYTAEISIVDENNEELIHLINNHKTTPINLQEMHPKNIEILLNIEDKSFYKHNGFNLNRIFKTINSNIHNNQSYGASTITQQYIKNVYLSSEKTFWRKLKELYYAIKLEQVATKDEILTNYLNCVYFGNDIYGIGNASKYYFNKSYKDLTIKEMTTFVALLNAPTYYSTNLDKLEEKKNSLLEILFNDGIITNAEYLEALKPVEFKINKQIYNSNLLFFTDALLNEYDNIHLNPKFNEKITIHTKYQKEMNEIKVTTAANYASIAVDKDGYIISLIGNKDYYESAFNIATSGKRDIGSTIKPILYYEALKCGYSVNTTYYSAPYSFDYHNEKITIKNNASIYPYKNIGMKEALATSDNIYAIKTHQALGFKTLANHLKKYNIEAQSLPSLALGSVGMSLKQLIRIYTQFFTEGKYLYLKYIDKIFIDDKLKYTCEDKYQILGEPIHFKTIKELMTGLFSSSIPHATASSIAGLLKTKCYGKSGLTDFDSYMIGFNDAVLVGVWAGYLDSQELTDLETKRLPKELFVRLINSYLSPSHSA